MKRNKIMALTALLTLIGAPLSKAQEKGGSQQSTPAQSEKTANKDSKATEQVKNQGQSKDSKTLQTKDSKAVDKTKDSKAPQQTKDSKTADKTKEETKKDSKNAQQTKEQPKDSKKNGKKENKNSSSAHNEDLSNHINRGYGIGWVAENYLWLLGIFGSGALSGYIGYKKGENANVDAKVQSKVNKQYTGNNGVLRVVLENAFKLAKDMGALKRKQDTWFHDSRPYFEQKVGQIADQRYLNGLGYIQKKLKENSCVDLLVKATFKQKGSVGASVALPIDQALAAIHMLTDIRAALVDKYICDFKIGASNVKGYVFVDFEYNYHSYCVFANPDGDHPLEVQVDKKWVYKIP